MKIEHTTWWANKDGQKRRIVAAPDVFEVVKQAYKDAGYVISRTDDVWDTDGRGIE